MDARFVSLLPLLILASQLVLLSANPNPHHDHHHHNHQHNNQRHHRGAHSAPPPHSAHHHSNSPHSNVHREHSPPSSSPHHQGQSPGGGPHHPPPMHNPPSGACGCGGGCPGRQSSSIIGGGQNGVPIFLFPDHAQKAVDVILGAEGAFYWDNDELAHRIFDLLAHKFPQKWFIVGVGNSPGTDIGLRVQRAGRGDFMHGTVKLQPGHSPFAFFDRRQFPRENETQLWYFVRAVEPTVVEEEVAGMETDRGTAASKNDADAAEDEAKRMDRCVRKATKSCIPASLVSQCRLDFLALIDQNTQPALYASEPLTALPKLMTVLNSMTQCNEQNEPTTFYAIMARDGDDGEEEEDGGKKKKKNSASEED